MNGIMILEGDCRQTLKTLPENSVHCCVTSPPYFNLRDYGVEGQIGLEESPEAFVQTMVEVFREVRRVLRPDGTLWLNLGDTYAGARTDSQATTVSRRRDREDMPRSDRKFEGLKNKDLIGVPWMVAFALRNDGWWLRQDIIWHKTNPMPGSASDRCATSHEYVFHLSKRDRYYFDDMAIQEGVSGTAHHRGHGVNPKATQNGFKTKQNESFSSSVRDLVETRNKRSVWAVPDETVIAWLAENHPEIAEQFLAARGTDSVWTVSTKPYKGAHFATYPPDLIRPCILAGTSEHGCCPKCGAPWERVTETERVATRPGTTSKTNGTIHNDVRRPTEVIGNRDPLRHVSLTKTVGWKATCECGCPESENVPCTVLDPFSGSGTTGEVARECGCVYIGCELNEEYRELSKKRLRQQNLLVPGGAR